MNPNKFICFAENQKDFSPLLYLRGTIRPENYLVSQLWLSSSI